MYLYFYNLKKVAHVNTYIIMGIFILVLVA